MPNRNDISIGKDKWITFRNVDGRQTAAVELDGILEPVMPFLDMLETECVAACCGIDAYSFWSEDIVRAAARSEGTDLPGQLDDARRQIDAAGADIFVSHRMNNYLDKRTLLELMDHIIYWVGHADDAAEQMTRDGY
jgi:hypothetical protein